MKDRAAVVSGKKCRMGAMADMPLIRKLPTELPTADTEEEQQHNRFKPVILQYLNRQIW